MSEQKRSVQNVVVPVLSIGVAWYVGVKAPAITDFFDNKWTGVRLVHYGDGVSIDLNTYENQDRIDVAKSRMTRDNNEYTFTKDKLGKISCKGMTAVFQNEGDKEPSMSVTDEELRGRGLISLCYENGKVPPFDIVSSDEYVETLQTIGWIPKN